MGSGGAESVRWRSGLIRCKQPSRHFDEWISIRDLKLTTTDATKASILVSGGSAAGNTPSGELNASQVKFDGDNAWRFDTANFFYSGFWEIDGCSFKKHTHFSTTQALNDGGFGMLSIPFAFQTAHGIRQVVRQVTGLVRSVMLQGI